MCVVVTVVAEQVSSPICQAVAPAGDNAPATREGASGCGVVCFMGVGNDPLSPLCLRHLLSALLSLFSETVNVTSVKGDPLPSKAKRGRHRTTIVIPPHSRFHRCRIRPRAAKHPARCRPCTSDSSSGQELSPAPKSMLIVIEANVHCMDGPSDGLGEMAVDTHCCCCCRCLAQRAVVRPSRRACTVYAVATQTKTVKIGTRGSPLALAQAYLTRDLLKVGAAGV